MSRYTGRLPQSYEAASNMLEGLMEKEVLNNTTLEQIATNRIAVKFHGNTIAIFQSDGVTALTDCGYATSSTYERLNALSTARWFVRESKGYVESGGFECSAKDIVLVLHGNTSMVVPNATPHEAFIAYADMLTAL